MHKNRHTLTLERIGMYRAAHVLAAMASFYALRAIGLSASGAAVGVIMLATVAKIYALWWRQNTGFIKSFFSACIGLVIAAVLPFTIANETGARPAGPQWAWMMLFVPLAEVVFLYVALRPEVHASLVAVTLGFGAFTMQMLTYVLVVRCDRQRQIR